MRPDVNTKAAIYTRISIDRSGTSESPAQQEDDCRALAERQGWTVAAVFTDRDISASKGAARPGYEALLSDLSAGRFGAVVVWELSRLTRQGIRGIAKFLDALESGGARLVTVKDSLDTGSGAGELVIGVMASIDKDESKRISERTTRNHAANAALGHIHPGGPRCFGYTRTGEVVAEEASLIRQAAADLVAGASLRSVVRAWNAAGVRTTPGGQWDEFPLRRLLRSPRLAGVRSYKGNLYPATWQAILTEEEHSALAARLSGGKRAGPAVRHALAGLVKCGRCGAPMGCRKSGRPPRGVYACRPAPRGCGGVSIGEAVLDAYVKERAGQRRVGGEDLTELASGLDADEASLAELAKQRFVTRAISQVEYDAARDGLVASIEANRRRLDLARSVSPGAWQSVLSEVVVMPAVRRGGNTSDPASRVKIWWRLGAHE